MSVTCVWLLIITDITSMHKVNSLTVTSTECKDVVTCYIAPATSYSQLRESSY